MATRRRERHTNDLCTNKEVTFYAVYTGSIPVDRSMRTLPYELRTAVTKEAIVKVCTAARCVKQDMKRPKVIKQINKILTQTPEINRLGVNFTISLSGLKATRSDNNKILMSHSMSAISFASCGEMPFKSFVGYVAKDPTLGRACHVFNCFGDAYDIVSTIGEAFSIKYEDVLSKHSQCNTGSFEFIEVNTGFFGGIFDEAENRAFNSQLCDPSTKGSKSVENIPSLYENLPRKAVISTPGGVSLMPRQVENSIFYLPKQEDGNFWPRTSYCNSPPGSPIGGRRKTDDESSSSTPSESSYSESEQTKQVISGPPVKPPRPKAPIYANIDEVDRRTYGAASNATSCCDTTAKQEEPTRTTPEQLQKNLEALECSLDEISSEKCLQQKPTNLYSKMSWFHGKICREEAERRLKYQGDYLVRSHGNGQFVLSCMDAGHARHLLLVDPHGQIRTRDRKFVSITDLVTHYATSGECIVSEGCALRIIRPVPHPS